jgi:PAS domain S-box-containing protein
MERKLNIWENRYRTLYEKSPAIIMAADIEGRFLYANPAMVEKSGYSETELQGMTIKDLIAPEATEEQDMSLRLFKEKFGKETHLQEVHFKTKGGDWKTMALNTFPIMDDSGNFSGVGGIGVDITETKRLNEQIVQTQRMDMLGQMAGGLAHDFNNLLLSINGYSQIIVVCRQPEMDRSIA